MLAPRRMRSTDPRAECRIAARTFRRVASSRSIRGRRSRKRFETVLLPRVRRAPAPLHILCSTHCGSYHVRLTTRSLRLTRRMRMTLRLSTVAKQRRARKALGRIFHDRPGQGFGIDKWNRPDRRVPARASRRDSSRSRSKHWNQLSRLVHQPAERAHQPPLCQSRRNTKAEATRSAALGRTSPVLIG
jgi:hypothetical protein